MVGIVCVKVAEIRKNEFGQNRLIDLIKNFKINKEV